MAKTVYYIHNNRRWHYGIATTKLTKLYIVPESFTEITEESIKTEKDCRAYLTAKYPDLAVKKVYLYHEGGKRVKSQVTRKHDLKDRYKDRQMLDSIKSHKQYAMG
jgi:hypothetical protein